jgi:hypothetical protein
MQKFPWTNWVYQRWFLSLHSCIGVRIPRTTKRSLPKHPQLKHPLESFGRYRESAARLSDRATEWVTPRHTTVHRYSQSEDHEWPGSCRLSDAYGPHDALAAYHGSACSSRDDATTDGNALDAARDTNAINAAALVTNALDVAHESASNATNDAAVATIAG